MPKRGEIEFLLTRDEAAALGGWLLHQYVSPGPSLLDPEENSSLEIAHQLGQILTKAARRRRGVSRFSVNIQRSMLSWFVNTIYGYLIILPMKGAQIPPIFAMLPTQFQILDRFQNALKSKRGRRKLSRSELVSRSNRRIAVEGRHMLRLRKRLRYEISSSKWFERLEARGESLIGSTEPFHEI